MASERIYLDHNASAPLKASARAAMVDALDLCGNASSVHGEGRRLRRIVEEARSDVAALVGASAEHVTFTSGATEAASTLLTPHWVMGRAPLLVAKAYVAASDHPCLLTGGRFAKNCVDTLPVDRNGILDLDVLNRRLGEHDHALGLPLVAIHHANNETGVVQPVAAIGEIVKRHRGIFIVDAVQSVGRIPIDIKEACADFLILSSHKIGGPKGAGAIVATGELMMPSPLVTGGGQEKGRRSGTENIAAIAGFGAAAREAASLLGEMDKVRALRDRFEASVEAHIPDAVFFSRDAERIPNTSFFAIPGMKAETAQIAFDLAGIALSAGSACSSGKVGPSHVLAAMGEDADAGALRISIGRETGEADLAAFERALAAIAGRRQAARAA